MTTHINNKKQVLLAHTTIYLRLWAEILLPSDVSVIKSEQFSLTLTHYVAVFHTGATSMSLCIPSLLFNSENLYDMTIPVFHKICFRQKNAMYIQKCWFQCVHFGYFSILLLFHVTKIGTCGFNIELLAVPRNC